MPKQTGNSIATAFDLGTVDASIKISEDTISNTDSLGYYKFKIAENSKLNIKLSGLSQNVDLFLLNADESQIPTQSVFAGNVDENIIQNLKAGSYYFYVRGGGTGTNYKIETSAISLGAIPVDSAGSSLDRANNLGTLGTTATVVNEFIGNFNGLDIDYADYHQFTISENSTVNLKLTGLSQNAAISLLDSQGTLITGSENSPADKNITQNLRLGNYYVFITNSGGNGTSYQLSSSAVSLGAVPVDNAGESLYKAKNLGVLGATATVANDFLGNFNGLSTDSSDYFQFTIADNSTVNLKLSGLSQDVNLNLYDSQGNLVVSSATGGNADENITRNLRAGTYYAQATGGGTGTNYQFAASAISLGAVPVDNAGDSLDKAKNIGVLGNTAIVIDEYVGNFGNFGGAIDSSDYYQFSITENSTVNLSLSGLSQDTNISLLDSQGNSIKTSATSGTSDEIISQKLRSGTYFVSVSPASGLNNGSNYRFSANAVGLGSTPVDANDINQASDLGILTGVIPTLQSEIASANYQNYYKFTLSENSNVNFKLSGLSQDANIELLSSQGNTIISAVNPGTVDETISKNLRTGVYYIRASRGFFGDPFATPTSLNFKLDASVTSLGAIPIDLPGNSIDQSKDLGTLKTEVVSATDFLGNFNNLSDDYTDYYKFILADNSTVNLKLSGLSQDANLVLLNGNGNTIVSSSNTGSSDENISRNLPKGTYYVRVDAGIGLFGFPTGPNGVVDAKNTTYKLDASAIALGAIPVDNAGENIDQSKDLGTIKTEVVSATDFLGNFKDLANDYYDYYKFTIADNSTVNLKLSGLSEDANLSLLNSGGAIILSSRNTGSSDENISRNLQKGTYYVQVEGGIGLFGGFGTPGTSDAKGTNYKLDVSAVSIGTPPVDNAGETINQARDLGVISEPQQIADYIGNFNSLSNDSADYYKFRVTTDSFLNLNFTETAINPNLQLFNSAGKLLSTPTGFTNLANTNISQGITAGTYYLGVTPNGNVGSNYKLNIAVPTITDLAGSDNQTARDVGILNGARAFTDFIGSIDSSDVYRFELKEKSTFNLNFNPDKSSDKTYISLTNAKGQWLTNINTSTDPISQELDAGVYYAGIYNYGGANNDTIYNLNLSAIPKQNSAFQILNVNPIAGSNQGEATIDIKGTKFTPTAKVSIVDPAGKEVNSSAVTVLNDTNIAAKFDLKGQVIGAYDVKVVDGTNQALANDVFLVNDLAPGRLQVDIAAPGAVRPGATGELIITYRNAGNTDIAAPLLTLVAKGALLEESGVYKDSTIQFLGINKEGNAGVLPAGATGSVRVKFRSALDATNIDFQVNSLALDENVDWNGIKDSSRPEGIAADVWDKIYSNFVTSVGGKASEFQKVLNDNANRLSQLGEYTGDISRLLSFELQQVNSNAISARSTVGAFGRGGVNPWDVTAITDAAGNVAIQTGDRRRTFTKGKDGKYQGITDDLGSLTKVGDVYQIKEFDGTVQSFLANGKLDFIQDTNGNKVTLGYTANLLTGLSYGNGDKVTFKYNAQGRVNEVVDIYGQSTTYTYDATGERLLSVSDVSGAVSYTYETEGAKANAIKSITYPDGTQSLFEYDDLGRVTQESLNGGEQTLKYSYDSTGGVTVTDANNKSTQVLLNDRGQVAQTTDALGRVSRFSYDSKGNLTQVLAPDSSNAKFTYDSKGNLLASTDALGQSVQFAYDSRYDQIKSVTDQKGNAINYSYDDKGNLGSIGYADGSKESFTYSDKGDVTVSSNRRGQQISYTYDSRGLLTKKAFADGTSAAFEYDLRGNLTKATDADSSVTYGYDTADRLTNVSYGGTRSLSFSYDAGGRRSKMVDQDGFATNYSYDSVGRLKQLTDKDAKNIVSYSYNTLGQLSREDNGENGTYTVYSYNDVGAVLSIVQYIADDNTVNSRFEYTYDDLGRLTSTSSEEGKTSYGYDATGRLTSETSPTGLTEYQYDAAGNRTVLKDSGVDTSYSTNNLNQYTKVGDTTYTYDRDGNLATKTQDGKTSSYAYDSENNLIEVKTPDETWKYEYDALGNKVATIKNDTRSEYLPESLSVRYVSGGGSGSSTGSATTQSSTDSTTSTYSGQWDVLSIVAATYDGINIFTNAPTKNRPTGQTNSPVPTAPAPTAPAPTAPAPTAPAPTAPVPKPSGDNPDCDLRHKSSFFKATTALRLHLADLEKTNAYLNSNDIDGAIKNLNSSNGALQVLGILRSIDITEDVKDYLRSHAGLPTISNFQDIQKEAVKFIGDLLKKGVLNATATVFSAILGLPSNEATEFRNRLNTLKGKLEGLFNIPEKFIALIKPITDTINGLELLGSSPESCDKSESSGSSSMSFPPNPNPPPSQDGLSPKPKPKPPKPILPPNPKSEPPVGDIPPNPIPEPFDPYPIFKYFPKAKAEVPILNSFDPNDIIGPGGTGTDRWLTPDPILPYTIRFENIATATAPAVLVNITHTLDSDLDLNTFELGDFGFGSTTITVPDGLQNYTTRLDLRNTIGDFVDFTATLNTTTRLVTWKIITIDPLTGEPAEGVTDGFLPPNNANRDGEGFVNYRIKAKSDTPNGASLDAQASIVFDTNAPIVTPVWSNKIDTALPSSQVTSLSANSSTNFKVAWTGADNGSGVAKYDIYVSDNGGNFTIWKQGITDTSATYTGELNHVYRFYSVATDGVGFQESAPNQADTSTTVVVVNNPPTVEKAIVDQNAKQGTAFNFQLPTNTFADIDAGDVLTYSATLENGSALPSWLTFDATTRTFSGTPTNDNVGNLNVKVAATDKAGASVSDIFVIAVENVNDAPIVANLIADQNAKQGNAFNFQIPTNTFTDIDAGDVLTYSATLENGNALPSWITFNSTTRTFSGTPTNDNVGNLNIKVAATDKTGATVSDIFAIAVENLNDAPIVANAIADQTTTESQDFSFTFDVNTFNDIDTGDSLTYAAALKNGNDLPPWLKFNAIDRTFSGKPTKPDLGSLEVVVRAIDKSGASTTDTFLLNVLSAKSSLAKLADDIFTISGGTAGKPKLQITISDSNPKAVNDLAVFTVDNAQGRINGIAPTETGYTQAALSRAKNIFSAIANLPNGFDPKTLSRSLEFNSGDNLRFLLVKNDTLDNVRKKNASNPNILFSNVSNQKITDSGTGNFTLAWEDGNGNSSDFKDFVVNIQATDTSLPLGANLQDQQQGEVLDLSSVDSTKTVQANFVVNREAAYNNFVGFYKITDSQGTITDPLTGLSLKPGDSGYTEAAIKNRVAGIDLQAANQSTATINGVFQGGSIFAPFIIANGSVNQLLDTDKSNDPAVYFAYLGANSDGVDHIRLLANNTFGFEDLPSGGDFDYNDIIIKANLSVA